ncbi:MAG: PEP-CTERM sorting domain-containing protein [Phycisphaerae bacterium]
MSVAYDTAGNLVPLPDITKNVGQTYIYEVDFNFTINNLAAGEGGLGSLAMDINPSAGLTVPDPGFWGGPWNQDTTLKFTSGKTTASVWAHNGDDGPSATDLLGIVAYIAKPPYGTNTTSDPRSVMGQNGPAPIGYVYLQWDGKSQQTVDLSNVQYATWDTNDANGSFSAGKPGTGGSLTFGAGAATPEPASIGMLALAGVGLLVRRRKAC